MADSKDLDETRRLLYMALHADVKRYNLAGTLINALRHHHGIDEPGLEYKVIGLVNGEPDDGLARWARDHITRITAELDGAE